MTIEKNKHRIPSICRLRYLFSSEIQSMNSSPDQGYKQVILALPVVWHHIYFTPGSAEFTEVQKQEDPGIVFNQTLRFVFPGEDQGNAAQLEPMISRPLVLGIEYSNKAVKLLGSVENPARVSKSFKTDSKGSMWEFTALCSDPDQAFWLKE